MARWFKLILFFFPVFSLAQKAEISGRVTDHADGLPLPGVTILINNMGAGTTGHDGYFLIQSDPGRHLLTFRFIGYQSVSIPVDFEAGEIVKQDVQLVPLIVELSTAVISASKYEQRLSDVTVSMEVLKPGFIEKQNTFQLDAVLKLVPGVDIMDDQASIRGGSGYSYGAGSRVMLLMDDLPMLTGDINEVKWNFIPVELIGQVEVIKGASSALYGSSALNGVINVRTLTPSEIPETTVNISGGLYSPPKRDELSWWWDRVPLFGGIRVSHLRKAGPFDLVLGLNAFGDEGYRTENYQRYGRISAGLRYTPPGVKGLSAGMNASLQYQKSSDFLLWTDADSGALVQNPVSVTPTDGLRVNADPYISYFDRRDGEHHLKTRYYHVHNAFPDDPDKDNGSDYYYGEYQYNRKFRGEIHLTAGVAASFTDGKSALYGDHTGSTMAVFAQADKRFLERLSLSMGIRWERYRLDNEDESKPVLRAGLNFKAAENTFLRASFGQGYRYPSMAEKYTATSLGSLNIFPNPDLTSETGWSAELGLRQGYRLGNWSGSVDMALFWMEYKDMMEFTFGLYLPDSNSVPTIDNIGFKSVNVGAAKINGIDFAIYGQGKAGTVILNYYAGYTYMNPLDLSADTLENQILKYRYRHSLKGDFEVIVKKYSAGVTLNYQSFIERIDEAFEMVILGQEFFPGLKEYRQENDKGAFIFDIRAGWQVSSASSLNLIVKNSFNREYMGRPGDIQPPRSISLQYVLKLK